jgi:hypothetical protein
VWCELCSVSDDVTEITRGEEEEEEEEEREAESTTKKSDENLEYTSSKSRNDVKTYICVTVPIIMDVSFRRVTHLSIDKMWDNWMKRILSFASIGQNTIWSLKRNNLPARFVDKISSWIAQGMDSEYGLETTSPILFNISDT